MSTPLMALPSTGPFRQYELTKADCQMSSISSGSLPIRNGLRYLSTAVSTARARWVKVAQPRPYRPGSLVSTLTTTSRMPAGAVRMVLTSVIFSGAACRGGRVGGPAGPGEGEGGGGGGPGEPLAAVHDVLRVGARGSPADCPRAYGLPRPMPAVGGTFRASGAGVSGPIVHHRAAHAAPLALRCASGPNGRPLRIVGPGVESGQPVPPDVRPPEGLGADVGSVGTETRARPGIDPPEGHLARPERHPGCTVPN